MTNKKLYTGLIPGCILFFLSFSLDGCIFGKSTDQTTNTESIPVIYPDWVEKVITKNTLDTLEFFQRDFLQEFSFERKYGVNENGELDYYSVAHLGNKELALIRRQFSSDTIFYLAAVNNIEKPQIEEVVDISSRMFFLQGQRGNTLVYIRFGIPEYSQPGDEKFYIDVCTETNSSYYNRNVEQYYFTQKNNFTSFTKQPHESQEENQLVYSYEDFLEYGKPDCLFTTNTLDNLEYITIAELFNQFSMIYYQCDISTDITFYVLPKYYKNHDLVIEQILTNDGKKYFLRKIRNNAPGFETEPVLDITPYRKELYADIKTHVECYEGNILLVFTEETEKGLTTKSICSWFPTSSGDVSGEYIKSQNRFMWLASGTSFYDDKKEEYQVAGFLSFYNVNYDHFNEIQLVKNISEKNDVYTYRINEQGCKKLLHALHKPGFFSDSYLTNLESYFNELDKYYQENPDQGGYPEGLEHDLFLLTLNPDKIRQLIERNDYTTIFVRPINEHRSIVGIDMHEHTMIYNLSQKNGYWEIDNFDTHYPLQKFYANGKRGALVVPKNEKQLERYLEYKGLDGEDIDYYTPIKDALYILDRDNVPAIMIDESYETIVLPNNIEISLDDLYLYDVIIYSETEHVIIRDIDKGVGDLVDGIVSLFFKHVGFDFSL